MPLKGELPSDLTLTLHLNKNLDTIRRNVSGQKLEIGLRSPFSKAHGGVWALSSPKVSVVFLCQVKSGKVHFLHQDSLCRLWTFMCRFQTLEQPLAVWHTSAKELIVFHGWKPRTPYLVNNLVTSGVICGLPPVFCQLLLYLLCRCSWCLVPSVVKLFFINSPLCCFLYFLDGEPNWMPWPLCYVVFVCSGKRCKKFIWLCNPALYKDSFIYRLYILPYLNWHFRCVFCKCIM